MSHDLSNVSHRWLAVTLALPTIVVVGAWVASCFVSPVRAVPVPMSWDWRVDSLYFHVERTDAAVLGATLPPGTLWRNRSGRWHSQSRSRGSYLGVEFAKGYHWDGRQAIPLGRLSVAWPVLLIGTMPLAVAAMHVWYRPTRQERRRKLGKCVKCDYDLRETPERCPECGREAVANG